MACVEWRHTVPRETLHAGLVVQPGRRHLVSLQHCSAHVHRPLPAWPAVFRLIALLCMPFTVVCIILMGSAAQSPYVWLIWQVVCVNLGAYLHMMALTMADSTHRYYSTSLLMSMPLHRVQTRDFTNLGASPDPEENNNASSHHFSLDSKGLRIVC